MTHEAHPNHRFVSNRHLAAHLRRHLIARHEKGTAARDTLDAMSDEELVALYLRNEQQGRAHATRKRDGQ